MSNHFILYLLYRDILKFLEYVSTGLKVTLH